MASALRATAWIVSGLAAFLLLGQPVSVDTQLALSLSVIVVMAVVWKFGPGLLYRQLFVGLGSFVVQCRKPADLVLKLRRRRFAQQPPTQRPELPRRRTRASACRRSPLTRDVDKRLTRSPERLLEKWRMRSALHITFNMTQLAFAR
jgi:hypothetical protein